MWKPRPDQKAFIEFAAKCEGVSEEQFVELAAMAVADYKFRNQ